MEKIFVFLNRNDKKIGENSTCLVSYNIANCFMMLANSSLYTYTSENSEEDDLILSKRSFAFSFTGIKRSTHLFKLRWGNKLGKDPAVFHEKLQVVNSK